MAGKGSLRRWLDKVSILTSVVSKFRKMSTVRRKRSSLLVMSRGKLSLSLSLRVSKIGSRVSLLLVTFIRCVISIYVHGIDVYIYIYLDKIPLLFSFLFVRYNDFDRDKFDKFSAFLFDRWIY